MKFLILLVIFVIFVFNSFSASDNEQFLKKYCDPSLTDTKIKELEKCEREAIEEVCCKPIFSSSLRVETKLFDE